MGTFCDIREILSTHKNRERGEWHEKILECIALWECKDKENFNFCHFALSSFYCGNYFSRKGERDLGADRSLCHYYGYCAVTVRAFWREGNDCGKDNKGKEKDINKAINGSQKKKNAIKNKEFSDIAQITEEDIKQLLIAYHVTASHVQVMIDSYKKEGIKQSPAYMWKAKGYLNFLILENKPRNLAVPLPQVTKITYQQNVEVNPLTEYEQMRQPSVVNAMYQEFLPVYKERMAGARHYYTKNLYMLESGICITNTSMKNAHQVLQVPIVFTGLVDERYSRYYRSAYEMKILLLDQVLSSEEYKQQISEMLKQMADEEGEDQEYFDDLALMVRARLVTQEVAKYFMEYRRKQEKARKHQKQ